MTIARIRSKINRRYVHIFDPSMISGLQVWLDPTYAGALTMGADPTLVDGDMELAGTANWSVSRAGTPSKQGGAYEGSKCLRVAYNALINPAYYQVCCIPGNRYNVSGWFRGDGSSTSPRAELSPTMVNGTSSNTWQSYNFETTSASTPIILHAITAGTGYAEHDDISIENLSVTAIAPRAGALSDAFSQAAATRQPWKDSSTGMLRFAGATDDAIFYSGALADMVTLHNGAGGTFVQRITLDSTAGTSRMFLTTSDNLSLHGVFCGQINGTLTLKVTNGSGSGYAFSGTCAIETGVNVLIYRVKTNHIELRINGVVKITGTLSSPSASNPSSAMYLCNGEGVNEAINGTLDSAIFYSRYISDSECRRLETYLTL